MKRLFGLFAGLFIRWPAATYRIPVGPIHKYRNGWIAWIGRSVEHVRRNALKYEVNEFGQWQSVGLQGGEMIEARDHFRAVEKELIEAERVVVLLRKDRDAMLAAWPGCDKTFRESLPKVVK